MRSLVERGIRALVLALILAGSAKSFAADAGGAPGADASPETTVSALPDSIPMIQNSQLRLDPNEIRITGVGNGSLPWTIIVLLTFLTLIPSLLLCMTPFARLLVVFHFLRQALGLQTTPTNQTLIGLALVLTFFLMQPVGANIYQASVVPLQSGRITAMEALDRGTVPVRHFMLHYVREKDVALFVDLTKEPRPRSPSDLSMRILIPAYILSELRTGFQIGTVLFLPFLAIDMIVASISTSVGMLQLPPVVISTPIKLLLFVMVDGWNLLIGSLMRSFN
jgi:flagellar biosynthesis protein FliP